MDVNSDRLRSIDVGHKDANVDSSYRFTLLLVDAFSL
jgi:hypothetical protein